LVATYPALPGALAASDLVATVPRRIARQIAATDEIEIMPLPVDFSMTVSMAWHPAPPACRPRPGSERCRSKQRRSDRALMRAQAFELAGRKIKIIECQIVGGRLDPSKQSRSEK
jgi:hypothetical protein